MQTKKVSMPTFLHQKEQMTGLKRKPSELPGDQPPPKLLKQTTSTTIDTAFEKDSDIDNIPPPILEKADSFIEERPRAIPHRDQLNDERSNSSTPPPLLPRFPTLKPTRAVQQSDKYFGFDIPSDDEEEVEDDTITKLAESICVGDCQVENESESRTKCIGTNTIYDSNGTNENSPITLKRADTVSLSDNNGSNTEVKKSKLSKKGIIKKVITPKKGANSKKDNEIKKEKSLLLNSLESLRTIQTLSSGTIVEKIMKFGAEEIILPSDRSLAVYEFDNETNNTTNSSLNSSSVLHRSSVQVVSDTLRSIDDESLPKLDCVSSEELTGSELSDVEINNTAPALQKMSITSHTKLPKKFIHGGIREIVFSFDTTGSMYSYMEEAKDRMKELVERLKIDIPGVRLAFMAHGDYYDLKNDRYLIKWLDFGATLDEICDFFEYLPITHGGDADECYELVLRKVRDSLSWTTGSQRCLVIIGDSDPHEPGYQFEEFVNDIDWREETQKLNEMGVRIYGMQVGYRSDFYRQVSKITNGAHLRLDSANLTHDMLMAVCLREGNLKLLKSYEAEVMKRPDYKGGLDLELARLFSSLKNVSDNIAMKFKKNLIEGTPEKENVKKLKAVKRSLDVATESPGSKLAKSAKKASAEDGKINKKSKLSKKLLPEKDKKLKKLSASDKIAKNLIKKAIKGIKEKKSPTREKKKTPVKKDKKITVTKEKKKVAGAKEKKKVAGDKEKKKVAGDKEKKKVAGDKEKKKVAGDKEKKKVAEDKEKKKFAGDKEKKKVAGDKEKKKVAGDKEKKKVAGDKEKKKVAGDKEKKKSPIKPAKKKPQKDIKKKPKPGLAVKKPKTVVASKIKKNVSKEKQTASKLKAKAVIKAILKGKKTVSKNKTDLKGKLKTPLKVKKMPKKSDGKNKTLGTKTKTLSKVKTKNAQPKTVTKIKPKVKTVDLKKKASNKLPIKKKEITKPKAEKKVLSKKSVEKTGTKTNNKKTEKEAKKKVPVKQPTTTKKTETKKSVPVKQTKPAKKNLQPREIASIAKFVTGPLSCLTWEPWLLLIAHEKQKSGNWSKGKAGCPGYCNSNLYKTKSSVPVVYEFAVSPPDSTKKYPVAFYSDSENVWEFHKNKYFHGEIERVIKSKGSISVRKGTVNKNDDALFVKTVEHLKNMFDYAWNSNSSKDTARKDSLVKEGFIVAQV